MFPRIGAARDWLPLAGASLGVLFGWWVGRRSHRREYLVPIRQARQEARWTHEAKRSK